MAQNNSPGIDCVGERFRMAQANIQKREQILKETIEGLLIQKESGSIKCTSDFLKVTQRS